jgi:shikimate dehydrogenase
MTKAGLIGGKLSHSLSPQIHEKYWRLTSQTGQYSLIETSEACLGERLDELQAQGYAGVNVTIPHKTAVMRYLNDITPEAQAIGAVNTVLFASGRRIGHNTDYFGLKSLLEQNGFLLVGKRVVILGSGGAARCALSLAKDEKAAEVLVVSRAPEKADPALNAVGYNVLDRIKAIDVLINATPSGMYPNTDACPVSDDVIQKCASVVDMIYNPEQTLLLQKAALMGKGYANGLWMLCAQALKAEEIWTGAAFNEQICRTIFDELRSHAPRTNIVLIGMPGSGKSTIGRIVAERLGYQFADTDTLIEEQHGRIPDIFAAQGEAAFREMELVTARQTSQRQNTVISTGGGIVQTSAAMNALKETGFVVYIDRPLETLLSEVDTSNRPLLAGGREHLITLFNRRHTLYRQYADLTVVNDGTAEQCAEDILLKLEELKK